MKDEELIIEIKKGNTRAFEELLKRYQKLVWHIVYRMTGEKHAAEDHYQEVFYRVYRNIDSYRGESGLSSWIGSIAFNVCSDYLRKKKNIRIFEEYSNAVQKNEIFADSPWDSLQKKELAGCVREAIEMLPVSYRLVISMFYLQELSLKEISEISSMPEGTVKSYLNRGRQMVKEKVSRYFPEYKSVYLNVLD